MAVIDQWMTRKSGKTVRTLWPEDLYFYSGMKGALSKAFIYFLFTLLWLVLSESPRFDIHLPLSVAHFTMFMMLKAMNSSKASLSICQITQHNTPEDSNHHNYYNKNVTFPLYDLIKHLESIKIGSCKSML